MGRQGVPKHAIQAARERYITGESLRAIAPKVGVSLPTLERYCRTENWRGLRDIGPQALYLDSSHNSNILKPVEADNPKIKDINVQRIRSLLKQVDDGKIIIDVLEALSGHLTTKSARDCAAVSLAIIKVLEFKKTLLPTTAGDIADLLLASRITPAELVSVLRDRDSWARAQVQEEVAG